MTKHKYLLGVLLVAIATAVLLSVGRQTAAAACNSSLPTAGGTATFTVNVPATGNYRFWTHLYAPSGSNNGVYLRVDNTYCQITVGDSGSIPSNKFTWVDYQGSNLTNKIGLDLSAGSHTITLAGFDDGVGVDKVLLTTDTTCVPAGDGANCTNAATATSAPVSGTIELPQATNGGSIVYLLDGKPIDGNKLDTSKLKDGTYTLEIRETDVNGKTTVRTQQIVVANNKKTGVQRTFEAVKQPLILLPIATILLSASAVAAVGVFRPELLRSWREGATKVARLFSRKPYWGYDNPADTAVVMSTQHSSGMAKWWGIASAVGFGIMGIGFIALTFAATSAVSYTLSNATLSGAASIVNQSSAIGGKMVRFASSSASPSPTPPSPSPTPPPTPGTPTCGAGQIGTPPNCYAAPPAPAVSGKSWNISFSEEFSGTTLNTGKLSPCFDWNYGGCTDTFNSGRETYRSSQVVVSDGTAKLIAAPLSPPYATNNCLGGQCTYKAGLLSTARPRADNGSDYLYKFTYGYVESRFKFPATQGFFTAFWMLPAEPSYVYDTEIDILEMLGDDPTTMFMTYHYDNRSQSYTPNTGKFNNGACQVKNYSQDFVRMGLDWQPNHIAWYIDGVKCGQFNGNASTIENGPMQLILHMMVDNNWQRSWGVGLQDPNLTRQLEVDYIRVYQQQ
jgi:hypothetical protein